MNINLFTEGLQNTADQVRTPDGSIWSGVNSTMARGVLEGIERYSTASRRTSYDADDVGAGFFYAEYDGTAEYLAVIVLDGDTTGTLYSVNPTTLAFTAIVRNDSDALTVLHDGAQTSWRFEQYGAYVYAYHPSGGVWVRRIGGPVGTTGDAGYDADDDWKRWKPLFERDVYLDAAKDVPPYVALAWPAATTVEQGPRSYYASYGDVYGFGVIGTAPTTQGTIRMNAPNPWGTYGPLSGGPWGSVRIELAGGSELDFSICDYIYFTVNKVGGDFPHWSDSGTVCSRPMMLFYISESDISPTESQLISGGIHFTGAVVGEEMRCVVDLSSVARASRNAVKTIVICLHAAWTEVGEFTISPLKLGGVKLSKNEADPCEYCYAYYNPTTQALSEATRSEVQGGLAWGASLPWLSGEDSQKLGTRVTLSASEDTGLFADGYTKVRFFRRMIDNDRAPTDDLVWKKLGEDDNSGSPTWSDHLRWDEGSTLDDAPVISFDGFGADLAPDAMGVWKSHMVVAQGRWLFISYAGEPGRFLPKPSEVSGQVVSDDIYAGRTVTFSQGDLSRAVAIIGGDHLFVVTQRGVVVMLGDTAMTATPPRLMPWSVAPRGPLSAVAWGDGVAVASTSGIFSYQAPRAILTTNEPLYEWEELTRAARTSWAALGTGNVVLSSHDNELFAFSGTKFMRLKRGIESSEWTEGAWFSVKAASSVPGLPFRAMDSSGGIVRMLKDSNGAAYTTDAGAAVSYVSESAGVLFPGGRIRKFRVLNAGSPTVQVSILGRDGAWSTWATVNFGGEVNSISQAHPAGIGFKVKVTGVVGTDKILDFSVDVEEADSGRR
ncbi:MAG: hypothetical protein WCZ86_06045 [Desulfurivibrionaceae bacterium]